MDQVEKQLRDTLMLFINEIDLSFDYIDESLVKKLKIYVQNTNVDLIKQDFYMALGHKETELSAVTTSKRKIKSSDYEFFNEDLVLFDHLLDFKVFNEENKNTKRTIATYIKKAFALCKILRGELPLQDIDTPQPPTNLEVLNQKQPVGEADFDELITALAKNTDIMNIATEISADLSKDDFDPMSMLSALLTGKPDPKLNKLVTNITQKIETKINAGQINKESLERQALSMLDAVDQSSLKNQMPNVLGSILKNNP